MTFCFINRSFELDESFGAKVKLNVKSISRSIQNHYWMPSSSSLVLFSMLIINAIDASIAPMLSE